MKTLTLNITDDLLEKAGDEYINNFMQKQLKMLEIRLLVKNLGTEIQNNSQTYEADLLKLKQEAWDGYKKQLSL